MDGRARVFLYVGKLGWGYGWILKGAPETGR